jgi:catechol 2,3-dioxygenase-like lactoylglutathione lyase family enzyme
MTAFYRDGLGLEAVDEHDGGAELDCAGSSLNLVRVPEVVAAEIVIADPPVRREDVPLKLVVPIAGLADVRDRIVALGGSVDPVDREWTWQGVVNVDAVDPEGNVVQLSAPA